MKKKKDTLEKKLVFEERAKKIEKTEQNDSVLDAQ